MTEGDVLLGDEIYPGVFGIRKTLVKSEWTIKVTENGNRIAIYEGSCPSCNLKKVIAYNRNSMQIGFDNVAIGRGDVWGNFNLYNFTVKSTTPNYRQLG